MPSLAPGASPLCLWPRGSSASRYLWAKRGPSPGCNAPVLSPQESEDAVKALAKEKDLLEREKWELRRQAKEATDHATALRSQLDLKDNRMKELEAELAMVRPHPTPSQAQSGSRAPAGSLCRGTGRVFTPESWREWGWQSRMEERQARRGLWYSVSSLPHPPRAGDSLSSAHPGPGAGMLADHPLFPLPGDCKKIIIDAHFCLKCTYLFRKTLGENTTKN